MEGSNFLSLYKLSELSEQTGIPIASLYRYRADLSLMRMRDFKRIIRVVNLSDVKVAEIIKEL